MISLHHISHVLALLILMTSTFLFANICIVESRQMSAYYGPIPEPDPGQPYNKYHWVKSTMEKLRSNCQKGGTDPAVCPMELEMPLGMENGEIPDSDLVASTVYNTFKASRARLNNQVAPAAWCAAAPDSAPWIQVNFNTTVYITGLITQANPYGENYVTTFNVKYGDSTSSLTYVTSPVESVQLFSGNHDRSSHVTNRFSSVLHAQYLRIYPVSWKPERNVGCLRFEVLGCR